MGVEEKKASHVFADDILNTVTQKELEHCIQLQHDIFKRTKESHQALTSFNAYSAKEFAKLAPEIERKTKLIQELKKDLYNIFDRISELRETIGFRFPEQEVILPEELEEDDDFLPIAMARKEDTETMNPDNDVKQEKELDSINSPESEDLESNLDTGNNINDDTDSTTIDTKDEDVVDKESDGKSLESNESVDVVSEDMNTVVENNELGESAVDDNNEHESKEIEENITEENE